VLVCLACCDGRRDKQQGVVLKCDLCVEQGRDGTCDVWRVACDVCAVVGYAHALRAGIVLTVVNVAIIVSVIKVFKARGSDAAKSSLSDI